MTDLGSGRRVLHQLRALRVTMGSVALAGAMLATLPTNADGAAPLRCQRAIEKGGERYLESVLATASGCVASGGGADAIFSCLFATLEAQHVLDFERARWSRRILGRCNGTDLGDLGYYAMCGDQGVCQFATPVIDAPGESNDVLDCLACRMRDQVRRATVKLFQGASQFATAPEAHCVEAIGNGGVAAFRTLDRELTRCLRRRHSPSIASCMDDARLAARVDAAMADWRSSAIDACGGLSPGTVTTYGYSTMCGGSVGFPGQACRTVVGPCTFGATSLLDGPGGEDDLLDCLRCRVEETGLALARLLQGANLCCTETGCDTVMTRRSCQRAGGRQAYYQIDDAGVPGFNLPHGIAFAPDGTMYVADQDAGQTITVSTVPPGGARSVLATLPVIGVPSGIALDQSLNAYVPVPCGRNIVYKVTPAGDVSVFAGTLDTAGNAGDGGPATNALLAAPRKAATDNAGNVYLTQSGILTLGCPSGGVAGNAEHIRMVDAAGTIHTVAGSGLYGSAGEGEAALSAQLGGLLAMLVTPDGSMLLGEGGTQRLLRIDPLPPAGILTRIAGRSTNPFGAYAGDGGPARQARFYSIEGIVQDAAGNVIVADFQNNRIRLVDRAGSIITIAGNGVTSANPGLGSGDGGPGELAFVGCPQDLVLAPDGRMWFHNQLGTRYFRTLRRVSF